MIYTWAADVAPLLDPIIYEAYYREVPQWRQEKADRIRFSEDRALSIGAMCSIRKHSGRAGFLRRCALIFLIRDIMSCVRLQMKKKRGRDVIWKRLGRRV